jgi:uncharacterized protein YggU (UPF0235/DUF167 family)
MYIKVKVHAGEKKAKLLKKKEDSFEIRVKEPAEQGRANEAVKAALAAELKVPPNRLSLVKGATGPSKIFLLRAEK